MIAIEIHGLDQFVVGTLSRELTPNIAKLYEVDEEEIVFLSPQSMVFHKGVEQTSWNILIKVSAPKKVSVLEDQMSQLLLNGIGDVAIHITVLFEYYSVDNHYEKINPDYPRYITEANLVDVSEDEYVDEDSESGEEDDEIYTGDIFEGLKK